MARSRFTPKQKIWIVLESINTNMSTAEPCRKHMSTSGRFMTG